MIDVQNKCERCMFTHYEVMKGNAKCRDVNEARSVRGRGHKVEAKAEAEAKCYEAEAECCEAEAESEARVD